jgi:hypothetical protein
MKNEENEMSGDVARMREIRNTHKSLVWGNLKGRDHSEDPLGVDGKIVLERILGKPDGKV